MPDGGNREGISESPHNLSPNLSAVAGHSNSKPPPSFVVSQSRIPCDAKASPYASASLKRARPNTIKNTNPNAAAKTRECVSPLCQAFERKTQTNAKSKSAAFAKSAPATRARR